MLYTKTLAKYIAHISKEKNKKIKIVGDNFFLNSWR